MAPPKAAEKKRKRNRKARTEVSSASSTSEAEPALPPAEKQAPHQREDYDGTDSSEPESNRDTIEAAIQWQQAPKLTAEQAFTDFYLQQATKEFANDLDKLRSASDFNERSVPILIAALKQGQACFEVEERGRVGEAVLGMNGA